MLRRKAVALGAIHHGHISCTPTRLTRRAARDLMAPEAVRNDMTPEHPRVQVVGFQWSPSTHEVKDFLARNRVPYEWLNIETAPGARELVARVGARMEDLPLLLFPDGTHLLNPSDTDLAERIGLSTEAELPFYDLVVVGGGPAGLSAAIYGASEGLRTLVVEREAPGGQAGMSSSVENYLGFPEGLTGSDLAQRGLAQARRFGVEVVAARTVNSLQVNDPFRVVHLDDGTELYCHSVLLAMGVSWRTLEAPGCKTLIGRGVYYGAASAEASACHDLDVYLVGGGNSAGQAAMLLSRFARSVTMVAPEHDFAEKMSEYLLERLSSTPNVHFRPRGTVVGAVGNQRLDEITIEDVESGEKETVPTGALFVFIGALPETDWLEGVVARDENGFILAGPALGHGGVSPTWPLERSPMPLETSLPGVFVAGDVRADSVKRIGSAVGEGAMAIQYIHDYLRES